MATKLGSVNYEDFNGGLDDTTPSTKLPITRAQRARNWNFVPGGGLQKRKGSIKVNSSALNSGASVLDIGEFRESGGTNRIITVAGDKIFKMEDLDGTFDDITGGLTLSAGNNNLGTHAIMNDNYIYTNGIDAPIKVNSSGVASLLGGSPPSGRSIIEINNFIFFGRLPSNKSRVQFSGLAAEETYDLVNDFIDVDPDDGDEIQALGSLFNNLYVFKGFSIHRIPVINIPFAKERIAIGIGCAGAKALTNVGGTHIIFMTKDGRFMAFDGSVLTDISSLRIRNKIASLNKSRLQFVSMQDYKTRRQIVITLSTGSNTTHDEILIYDYSNGITDGAWMPVTGIAGNAVLSMLDQRSSTAGSEILLTGDYTGFVRIQDTGNLNDDGGKIDAFWETGWNYFGTQHNIKILRAGHILTTKEGSGVTMDFKVGFDFETDFSITERVTLAETGAEWGSAIWGVDLWSGKTIIQKHLTDMASFGLAMKFGFQSNSISPLDLMRSFEVRAKPAGTRVAEALT